MNFTHNKQLLLSIITVAVIPNLYPSQVVSSVSVQEGSCGTLSSASAAAAGSLASLSNFSAQTQQPRACQVAVSAQQEVQKTEAEAKVSKEAAAQQASSGDNSRTTHPLVFGQVWSQLAYFHAPDASQKLLDSVAKQNVIFEIDLSWAHSSFNTHVREGHPYIGHPEEFYTVKKMPFPSNNIGILEFQTFLMKHPSIKVLIDIKDETVYPFLQQFIKAVGPERCIVHAFIKNWTRVPQNTTRSPHWDREDVDVFKLDGILAPLKVPLIANCRGFNDANVEQNDLVAQMLKDSKQCSSVVALGLFYSKTIGVLPEKKFFQAFHDAGYYAWVNGDIADLDKQLGNIRRIAMTDHVEHCTQL